MASEGESFGSDDCLLVTWPSVGAVHTLFLICADFMQYCYSGRPHIYREQSIRRSPARPSNRRNQSTILSVQLAGHVHNLAPSRPNTRARSPLRPSSYLLPRHFDLPIRTLRLQVPIQPYSLPLSPIKRHPIPRQQNTTADRRSAENNAAGGNPIPLPAESRGCES